MKFPRTLLSLVLVPSLFLTEINQLQAGSDAYEHADDITFTRAVWRKPKDLLVFRGTGTPGTEVKLYLAGTDSFLGSHTVNRRGRWHLIFFEPASIPCSVRAESSTSTIETDVHRAPDDCVSQPETTENSAPVIAGSPRTQVAEGEAYSFVPSADDADGDDLTFSIVNRPSWCNFNSSTGRLSGTPDYNAAGTTRDIRISVSDGTETATLDAFSLTVDDSNRAPTISGSPVTNIEEGTAYSFTPTASDPDGDALTFSISNMPAWAAFNSNTGNLSGTPGSNSAGTYSNVVISVSDGSEVATLGGFTITIADNAPEGGRFQFAQAGYSVDEGSSVTLTITRDNSNGEARVNYGTYGVEARHRVDYNGFPWTTLVFNEGETSKTITLQTLSDDVTESDETLGVHLDAPSDGYSLASPSISVVTIQDVSDPNSEPVISGTPDQNAVVGSEYRFTPDASDADNDTLSFSVTNLPAWASFNNQNGVLSGTPSEEDVGTFSDIVISVSDGTASASLSPLNITVAAAEPEVGSISLSWVPPTSRTDGTALDLSEISGYKIYMGSTRDNLEQVVDLADCTVHDYVVNDLVTGDYYFAVTTYDMEGNESDFSNVAMKSTM
ncbi:MAG: putative Ig domain-containing protein [Candidatus Thiodiazotropha sp. (ex Ctena orbiculata)]|nr:putative Ig domain-containing protein [Candidatus Thiodiazotropha taylori]MBT2997288.1 putative Ig domain-containing protein [Candidatus Thiodiazotropha taylori]MBT3001002.1 putative Ig domain-containing protein [Candidatus Thiodiazotropha taylori]MBV2108266.1 putative Ig domain-containing protein [Candidatus Thiodiazotropha taylori]MBV2111855.1 putative Ig domain-containing protein [Candidatus Thiodiazotropha taylori]